MCESLGVLALLAGCCQEQACLEAQTAYIKAQKELEATMSQKSSLPQPAESVS
jgi:hypothetical protein